MSDNLTVIPGAGGKRLETQLFTLVSGAATIYTKLKRCKVLAIVPAVTGASTTSETLGLVGVTFADDWIVVPATGALSVASSGSTTTTGHITLIGY